MNRFRTINPEWLILDIGTMYRQEKHSQTPTLFDSLDENIKKSEEYTPKSVLKTNSSNESIQKKMKFLLNDRLQTLCNRL